MEALISIGPRVCPPRRPPLTILASGWHSFRAFVEESVQCRKDTGPLGTTMGIFLAPLHWVREGSQETEP